MSDLSDDGWGDPIDPVPAETRRAVAEALQAAQPLNSANQHYLTAISVTVKGNAYMLACVCGWLAVAYEIGVGGIWDKHRKGEQPTYDWPGGGSDG